VRTVHGSLGGEDETEFALTGADQPAGGYQYADAAGIAEQHSGEVDHEAAAAVGHGVVHPLSKYR
jgi:hypothetical protein